MKNCARPNLNDVAIMLTQRIAMDLNKAVPMSLSSDNGKEPYDPYRDGIAGSFYDVRESILKTLNQLVHLAAVEHEWSPMEVEKMRNKADYIEHLKRANIHELAKLLWDKAKVSTWEPDQVWGWMRKDTYTMAVIDLNKLEAR